jgi:hypothetical protein
MMNKKGALPIVLIIFFVAIIGFAITENYVNLGSVTGSGGYIERPVFKSVVCEPTGSYKTAGEFALQSGGEWLYKPSVTDKYDVVVSWPDSSYKIEWWTCNSKVLSDDNCNIDSKNRDYSNVQGKTLTIQNVQPERYVWVKYQKGGLFGLSESNQAKYKIGYTPYGLKIHDVLNGGITTLSPNDCTVALTDDSWKDRIISTDSKKASAVINQQGKFERTLGPNEVRNYISGYVTSPAEDKAFMTYKNQNAWCLRSGTSATIFKVNTISTGSGTYKIASTDWSDELGSVTCCPGDKKPGYACNDKFVWVSNTPIDSTGKTNVQCSAFNPCQGGTLTPYDKQTLAKYSCVSGSCVLQTQKVDCAANSDCNDANKLCDTNTWKCIDANVNLKGEVIKTLADNSVDCAADGGKWVSDSTTTKEGTFCFAGYGICESKTVVQSYCKYSSFNFSLLAWILIIIALGAAAVAFRGPLYAGLMSARRILRI